MESDLHLDLQLEKAISAINKQKAKRVCIQLPDGLKPKAEFIQLELKRKTNAEIFFWFGSCYGACDTPPIKKAGFDLFIQFGHSEWKG
ncbi:MAG TPA: diphthamide synthesis protein [Candidatus Nanoarchaeia archaeon]|nr:diphthamide synthesis protein [Candidatus Nanoarchaeia archaeon]